MEQSKSQEDQTVVIIGAGISGLCMAIDLIRRNKTRNFLIVEKNSQVGGTWFENTYDGCSSDARSHLYSFSFQQNPDWKHHYPSQREINAYLIKIASRWGLYSSIRFNTTVKAAEWDDIQKKWRITLSTQDSKGNDSSRESTVSKEGSCIQRRWGGREILREKKIAVIGNGASGIQLVPEVSKLAGSLTIFQRTPQWIIPKNDKPVTLSERMNYRYVPGALKHHRETLTDSQDEAHAMVVDSDASNWVAKWCQEFMKTQIPDDEELRAKLTPDYPAGCNRVLLSDEYFPTLQKSNVHLETSAIEEITSKGIKVNGEEREFDIIIMATGFRTSEFLCKINIVGLDGHKLEDIWKEGAHSYLGVTVEHIPNFGMLYGPNTNLSHTSVTLMIEAQSRYISAMVGAVLEAEKFGQNMVLVPKLETVERYNSDLQQRLQKTTFAHPAGKGWYKTKDGKQINNWPGTALEYQQLLSDLNWDDYSIFTSSKKRHVHIGKVVEDEQSLGLTPVLVGSFALTLATFRAGFYSTDVMNDAHTKSWYANLIKQYLGVGNSFIPELRPKTNNPGFSSLSQKAVSFRQSCIIRQNRDGPDGHPLQFKSMENQEEDD
ncbi:hypothetical protein G7Y89_g2994 [Cudoniella acicularis]|uniref:Flavin-containing monooxygenase n=1 Tax=Cudoniella acicularis TaxID=354080 RepID=A0A8H4RT32_9HELO|nr:hypothetical protein G7Y89_g2994 [Cudoniella acicularis]